MCHSGKKSSTKYSWGFLWVIFLGLAIAGVGGYVVYKHRIRVSSLHKIAKINLTCNFFSLDNFLAFSHNLIIIPFRLTWIRRFAPSWLNTCL